jgi:hypothetical protein
VSKTVRIEFDIDEEQAVAVYWAHHGSSTSDPGMSAETAMRSKCFAAIYSVAGAALARRREEAAAVEEFVARYREIRGAQ